MENISFGYALEKLKEGKRVARSGWNGKNMWLFLIEPESYEFYHSTFFGVQPKRLPWIGMKTANNEFVPWLASQTDLLEEDWMIL